MIELKLAEIHEFGMECIGSGAIIQDVGDFVCAGLMGKQLWTVALFTGGGFCACLFPAMFYGAFSCYIGKKNFASIRTAIGDAILHRTVNSNPWLVASMLNPHLLDPLLYVIRESLNVWFTFLHRYPDMRFSSIKNQGKPYQPTPK